jgi:hypothetical protein
MLVHPASHPQHVHFFPRSCTPPRTLNTCTFSPVASTPRRVLRHLCTCIARPLYIDGATSCRVSCFARQLSVSCRAVAVSSITSVSFTLCAVRHALVHLECSLALLSHRPPKASTTSLSLVLSPLEHRLEQYRTATLSATSLSSPPPICAPSCEHQWHSSPHSHLPTTPLFVLLLDVRRVLFPALSETVNCRATSPRLVQFADTTLPFDGNSHDRVVSCYIFLTMSLRTLVVCSLHRRLASSCRWRRR